MVTTTVGSPHTHDVDLSGYAPLSAHNALALRVGVLEAALPKVVPFSGNQSQFLTLLADMTVDVIEMAGGTYTGWRFVKLDIDRTARPMIVRPAPGATVTFDGTGAPASSGEPLFAFGEVGHASRITFDGTGGLFDVRNYRPVATGVITTNWADNIICRGFRFSNLVYTFSAGGRNWVIYISSDGTHAGSNLEFSYIDVALSGRTISAFLIRGQKPPNGVAARLWAVSGCDGAFVGRYAATAVVVDGWTVADCNLSFDSDGPAGVVRNVRATNAGTPIINAPMIDGGGNVWS